MATATVGPLYLLADYLDQHGRAHRACQIPPAESRLLCSMAAVAMLRSVRGGAPESVAGLMELIPRP
jgi:hypothetical protein